MKNKKAYKLIVFFIIAITFMIPKEAFASPHFNLSVSSGDTPADYVDSIKILIFFTMLTLLPSFIIMFTSFTRITVVFSLLKNAIGAQQSIPSQILVGLAIFLTIFIMQPVYTEINEVALKPYSNEEITFEQALENASNPIKDFMLKETRQKDLELFVDAAKLNSGELTRKNIPLYSIVPAFAISELKTAFQIGFLLFVPFMVIDMIVASVLMSMGMMMLPPTVISLAFKLLLFVMVDGWNLIVKSLIKVSEALLNGIIKESIMTVIKVAGPFLAAALIIGLIISIIQATTQIQEQTLTFVPKLLGICAIGLFLASWISKTMVQYTENIYNIITKIS